MTEFDKDHSDCFKIQAQCYQSELIHLSSVGYFFMDLDHLYLKAHLELLQIRVKDFKLPRWCNVLPVRM